MTRLKTVMEHAAWLLCLIAAASATQGLRSAKTLTELYAEWSARRGDHAHTP